MPIVTPKVSTKMTYARIKLDGELNQEIEEYIKFAGFEKPEEFIVQAIRHVLSTDKEFKRYKKKNKK